MASQPITPHEALKQKAIQLPSELTEAVNSLIVEKLNSSRRFNIRVNEIYERVQEMYPFYNDHTRWISIGVMDFEPAYELAGWKVTYTQPDYTESFDSYYTFEVIK